MYRGLTFLVTGGGGFIGSGLVRSLLTNGATVRVLDDFSRGSPSRLADIDGDIVTIDGDIRDVAIVEKAARGVDWVLHLAAVNGTENFYKYPERVIDVSIRGVLAVIDACRAVGVRNLMLASSAEVYQTAPVVPTDEQVPLVVPDILNPRYSYGGGKIITELVGINYGRTGGFDRVVIFRPHNVYGPDMGGEHVLPQLTLRSLDLADSNPNGPIVLPILGDGTQTRAFAYIDDVVDGIMTLVDKGEHLGIYHIGNPAEVTIARAVEILARSIGRDIEIQAKPDAAGSTQRRCPDIGKISSLGYFPKVDLERGMPNLVEWYSANRQMFKVQ